MKSRVLVAGHALHPMLVAFPLGLLATSLVWDICRLATGHARWGAISFWTIVAGIVGGLVAAIPGFVDWLAIPKGTRAKQVGQTHMLLNLAVIALFVLSLIARAADPGGYPAAGAWRMGLGWLGLVVAVASAWLGGELVETLGVSVHDGANPDAPSSMPIRPPRRTAAGTSIPIRRGT
jgi:uncharacterized membrane protein